MITTTAPESVAALSERLGLTLGDVCVLVSALCEEYGPDRIVETPASMRRTVLTPFAVECIAERDTAVTAGAR